MKKTFEKPEVEMIVLVNDRIMEGGGIGLPGAGSDEAAG